MKPKFRVHISPVGFDPADRVTQPLLEYKADRVYLVSLDKKDKAADKRTEIKRILSKHPEIEVLETYTNIFDLFSCLEMFRHVFEVEEGNDISVNISTGSKVISNAGMLASMLWKGAPYYVMLDYEEGGPSISVEKRKVKGIEFLPVYEINRPSPESLHVLSIVGGAPDGKLSKKDLIEKLEKLRILPPTQPDETKSAAHSRLRPILDPLEKHWHLINVTAKGRRSEVSLTDQGRSALRIFGSGAPAKSEYKEFSSEQIWELATKWPDLQLSGQSSETVRVGRLES